MQVTTIPKTPTIDTGANAASDCSRDRGYRARKEMVRMEAYRVAQMPENPAVSASDWKVSPKTMEYVNAQPRQQVKVARDTIQDEFSPTSISHISVKSFAPFAWHIRPSRKKV